MHRDNFTTSNSSGNFATNIDPQAGQVMSMPRSLKALKGRGAVTNVQGRYELDVRETFDDGWLREEEEPRVWRTQVTEETAKSILSRNQSPDIPFGVSLNPYRGCEHGCIYCCAWAAQSSRCSHARSRVSLNPYRGCEHGCIYCFARPTHSYLGLSPGLDFESKLFAKMNAPDLLRSELSKPGYTVEPIALGVNTDAYQPVERELKLTRRVLEVLQECRHPVGLITKSALIERDIDILAPMAENRLAAASITLTTLDPKIARTLEPRAAAPERRLRAIRTLTEAGIPVGVSVAPIIPFVTEPEIEKIIEAAFDAGAVQASYVVLRLPWEVNPLFQQWLEAHFPDRAQRVMNRVREIHGGKDYDASFATRMGGQGLWADLIRQRVEKAIQRCGMAGRGSRFRQLDCTRFRRPLIVPPAGAKAKRAEAVGQLSLFD